MKVTAEDIAQLLASSPPRRVPAHVLKTARAMRSNWILGGIGAFFVIFSIPFLWAIFPWRIVDEWRLGDGREVPGRVTAVTDTRMSVNNVSIHAYAFSYRDGYGQERRATCFAPEGTWTEGADVAVRYLPSDPATAMIEGAHLNAGGPAGVFIILFPVMGLGMLGWFIHQRVTARRLLESGLAAEVEVAAVEATNHRVNKRPVYALHLLAPGITSDGRLRVLRVAGREVDLAEQHRDSKEKLWVLYDPRKPRRLLFAEMLIEEPPGSQ